MPLISKATPLIKAATRCHIDISMFHISMFHISFVSISGGRRLRIWPVLVTIPGTVQLFSRHIFETALVVQ